MKAYTQLLGTANTGLAHPPITLTTDHQASSLGQPVALIGNSGPFGVGEIIKMFGSAQVIAGPKQLVLAADEQDCAPKNLLPIIDAWNDIAAKAEMTNLFADPVFAGTTNKNATA